MGSTRSYDFVTGFETSTAPTATTPTTDSDTVTKGYADTTYAARQYWGHSVADTTALKAIGTTGANARFDTQIRLKDDDQTLWKFDASSSATEDGTTVIQPTSGTGRWLVVSGGGGGASGTASALEALQQKLESEKFGVKTREFDNCAANSGGDAPLHSYVVGYLIDNYTSGGSTITAVWNPVQVRSADQNMDSTTNWSATGAGASLTTSATAKIGTASIRIDKNNTATEAGIRYDQGSQILSVGANYRVYFWVNLPSITGLSNVGLRMYADSTSNFRTWTTTTDYAGNALAIGWNLIFVDISTGGTASGSGWTSSQLSRYQELFVTTSSSGQTYTAVLFDALNFSLGDVANFAPAGIEFTGFDTSNKNDFRIDAANTRLDGVLSLDATVAQSYTAGISNSNACKLERSTLTWTNNGAISFDSSLSSGAIATTQEVRLLKQFRESLSCNLGAFVDMYTPQVYRVTSVGGSTIGVEDPANTSANLLNGDSVHIFETIRNGGEVTFALRATRALTAGASHSSGTTTLTLTTTSIAVGDFIVKQHLSVHASLVSKSADESMQAMNYDTTPNGAQLIDQGRAIPYPANLYSSWALGDQLDALALRDRSGNGRDLIKVGSPNLANAFQRGRYSAGSFTGSSYLTRGSGNASVYDGNGEKIQLSFWLYFDATNGADRAIVACTSASGAAIRGWVLIMPASSTNVTLSQYNDSGTASLTIAGGSLANASWNHVFAVIEASGTSALYVNGALIGSGTGAIDNRAVGFYWGAQENSTSHAGSPVNGATNLRVADAHVWRDGTTLSVAQIQSLYNAGAPVPTGFFPVLRNEYSLTGQSGQKLSMRARLSRSTSAVSPQILSMGVIKTS